MSKLAILGGPDRLAFANSLFAEIDAVPMPGMMSRPNFRGGDIPPSYRGEAFLVADEDEREHELLLIITSTQRKGRDGKVQEFTAVLWADCDEFRSLNPGNPGNPWTWVEFRGELNFETGKGFLEQVGS